MPKKKRKARNGDSPEVKAIKNQKRAFHQRVRSVFDSAGFAHIPSQGKEITFKGWTGEFDGIFLLGNIIVISEDTCSSAEHVRTHLNKKHLFYEHLNKNKDEFVTFLESTYPEFAKKKDIRFSPPDMQLLITYCSKQRIEDEHKGRYVCVKFLEDRHLQYFATLAKTLGETVKYELFKFFGLKTEDVCLTAGSSSRGYDGFVLPESPSGFPEGYKIATFYVDPETLMSLAYVLRKDGWQQGDDLYQRMISRSKLRSMRQYLSSKSRVFINNVIVSLPSTTRIVDLKTKKEIDFEAITKTTPMRINVPIQFNSIGIIDGQHRVFAYHQGKDAFEKAIAVKRTKQQLLVTGVVYPEGVSEADQREFEAQLFLEINDKQTRARPDLRQAIEAIVNPFSVIAIARAIITNLAGSGVLCGVLEEHQFDRGKLKSSSIVSYGLKHIVKCEGPDSLFTIWKHPEKDAFAAIVKNASRSNVPSPKPKRETLDAYIKFCTAEIRNLLAAYKSSVPKDQWTLDRKKSRALSATAINGVIFCLRRLLEEKKTGTVNDYLLALKSLNQDYTPAKFRFKSSHWSDFGNRIYDQCFKG